MDGSVKEMKGNIDCDLRMKQSEKIEQWKIMKVR